MDHKPSQVALQILICDPDPSTRKVAEDALRANPTVLSVAAVGQLDAAKAKLRADEINTVFIDPLGLDLGAASEFVFGVRKTLPEIVFVLYINRTAAEKRRSEFYRGERRRFNHYYTLDKETAVGAFADEVGAVIELCQADLSWRLSAESLSALIEKADRLTKAKQGGVSSLEEFRGYLSRLPEIRREEVAPEPKTVFLSHRFAEDDYVEGLSSYLEQSGFRVVTGKAASDSIGKAVLNRIRETEFFLCLLTRTDEKIDGTYATSAWLLQELGAAIAFGKKLVIMVEDGVTDLGGLQGDWQRIHFGAKGFLKAALGAVDQLRSYAGEA